MHRPILFGLIVAAVAPSAIVLAQASSPATQPAAEAEAAKIPFDRAEAAKVVEELAVALEENFVFPDKGKAYAERLRARYDSGAYVHFPDGETFAETVTADLQAVHPDGHLRLHPPQADEGNGERRPQQTLNPDEAIGKAGWIADGVAYISFGLFPGDPATLAKLSQFLEAHASAKTLIIDARTHRGGGLTEMDLLFPLLFGEPQTLVEMDTRVAVEEAHGPPPAVASLEKVQGPDGVVRRAHKVAPSAKVTGLRNAKVFLLTSGRTASAAEHLALSLKRTGRATLVGETSAGAGHYGGMIPFAGGYAAFIPVGRTFDPDTNEGWEGVGVKPDIEVPAEQALVAALTAAGVAEADARRLSAEYRPEGSMERKNKKKKA